MTSTELSTHMVVEADIVVETLTRRILRVDCTWMKEPSLAKVTQLRDDLAQMWSTRFEYFMVTLRAELYLWRDDAPAGSPPQFTASAKQIWRNYLGERGKKPDTLLSDSMELAVASWLNDLANNVAKPDPESEADQLLLRSGLYDQMKGGVVRTHVPS